MLKNAKSVPRNQMVLLRAVSITVGEEGGKKLEEEGREGSEEGGEG